MATARSIDLIRERIYEQSDSLTPKIAQRLFEEPFSSLIAELDDENRKEMFTIAKDEIDSMMNGNTSWPSTFNTYVELAYLVELIRADYSLQGEALLNDLAQVVFSAPNRLATLFYVLRTNKDITEAQGKTVVEAAFPLALTGLSIEAKSALFSYIYERNSGLGWGQVAEEYSKIIDFVASVKPVEEDTSRETNDENE